MKKNKVGYYLLGLFISLLLLWFSIKDINYSDFQKVLVHINFFYVFPMWLAMGSFFLLKVTRWKLLLLPIQNISIGKLFPSLILGVAAGYMTFLYMGELVRVLYASHNCNLRKMSIIATIFLERIFDILAVLILILMMGIFAKEIIYPIKNLFYLLFFLGSILLISVISLVIWTRPFLNMCQRYTRWLNKEGQQRWIDRVEKAIFGFHSLLSFPILVKISAISFLQWLIMGGLHYLAISAVGVNVPYSAPFFIMGLIICGFLLPSLPGQIGLIEFCYVFVLNSYGVAPSYALAAAIIYHVLLYMTVVLIGLLYLVETGVPLKHFFESFLCRNSNE